MHVNFSFAPDTPVNILPLTLAAAAVVIIILLAYRRFPVHLIYKSKINLQSMLDAINEPLAVISKDYKVKRVNRAYCAMTGRSFKASLDAPCYTALRNRLSPCDDCRLNAALRFSAAQQIDASPHPCGAGAVSITFSPYAMPVNNSTELCIIEHIRDITTLEKLKNDLVRRNRFLTAITGKLRTMQRNTTADLKMARQIQLGLLPSEIPKVKGARVDAIYQPVTDVGGDIYDFFHFDENKLGIFIGDASGHGFAAALIGTLSKMSLYHHSRTARSTAELITAMNLDLTANIHSNHYLTCFWCIFDFEKSILSYSKAGHPAQLVLRKDGTLHNLCADGTLLGLLDDAAFEQKEFRFEEGDRFFLFTDGIYDAVHKYSNDGNVFLSYNQFTQLVKQTHGKPFNAILSIIKEGLTDFKQEDDYTLIVAEICAPKCESAANEKTSEQAALLS